MTPNEIRQTLSKKLLAGIVSVTLQKLPSLTGAESFDIEQLLPEKEFQFKPTNTMGLLVDRLFVELPDNPSLEQIDDVLVEQILNPESAVAPTVESLATKMASAISSTYGALRDAVIPAAEDICDEITQKLAAASALGSDHAMPETNVVMFDWGLLSDPILVTQALTIAQNKTDAFHEGIPLRPHHVSALFTAAGKSIPEHRIRGEERETMEKALVAELGDAAKDIGQLVTFFTSPEGFRCFYTNMKPQFHQSGTVTQASDTLQNLHLIGEKLYDISRREEIGASEDFKHNLANASEALSLLTATLQASRKVFYGDALVLSHEGGDGTPATVVLNTDLKMQADLNQLSGEDCARISTILSAEQVHIGDRGISVDTLTKERERCLAKLALVEENALKARLGQDSRTYYGVVENALGHKITEMVTAFKPKLRGRDLGKEIRQIAVSAVQNEGNTFDSVTRLGVSLTQNPALERMLDCMESVSDEVESMEQQRCEAFTRFSIDTLAAPGLIEA